MDNKTVWTSDMDLNGMDTVARLIKMDGNYYLEVVSNTGSFWSRLKSAFRLIMGRMVSFSFLIMSDKDTWVRRVEDGRKDS